MWFKLGVMTVLSFTSMYLLMYTMVDKWADVYLSISRVWMAGSMTAAMVAIELIVMAAMYKNTAIRYGLVAVSAVALVACIAFTRFQTAIYDQDFLRAMIPHHSGAILMCSNPKLEDPEIKELCRSITESQQREIDEMNAIMQRK
jgi:uncharacterized protein (DUF305 family)